jgi:uncharacterized protein (DUF2336 family)
MLADDRARAPAQEEGEARLSAPRSRIMLAKRVTDVVCLPSSEITPQERQLAGDLLVEMLLEGDADLRRRCARRVAALTEPPHRVLRLLARDEFEIARPILENSDALSDADIVEIAERTTEQHRLLLAHRDDLGELVVHALVENQEPEVIRVLLCNNTARFYYRTLDQLIAMSKDKPEMTRLILRRQELRPSQALAMFWWSPPEERRVILLRFGAERRLLQEAAGDVFGVAAAEGWSDALSRKALQFIDRRQRNRAAIEKSPYDSLEDAVRAGEAGLTRELVAEISYLSGIKPVTGAQIFTDLGGEPLAVLCKATGLKRPALESMWRGLKREGGDIARPSPAFARVVETFDVLSNEKAQTVLRYWNWSLSSALSSSLVATIRSGVTPDEDEVGLAGRTAALVFDF